MNLSSSLLYINYTTPCLPWHELCLKVFNLAWNLLTNSYLYIYYTTACQ
nr:MAG TPA: hypothetical protein [Caudoviricetes sp.]